MKITIGNLLIFASGILIGGALVDIYYKHKASKENATPKKEEPVEEDPFESLAKASDRATSSMNELTKSLSGYSSESHEESKKRVDFQLHKPDIDTYLSRYGKDSFLADDDDDDFNYQLDDSDGDIIDHSAEEDPGPNEKFFGDSDAEPVTIRPEEFGRDPSYETMTLLSYTDGLVSDDAFELIEDVRGAIGDAVQHMGEFEEDVIHVRNDRLKVYYEVLRSEKSYQDDILRERPYLEH